MKKILLSVLLISVCSLASQAQSSIRLSNNEPIVMGGIYDVITAHGTVKNIGSTTANYKVKRVSVSIPAEHSTYFCWVSCYGPMVDDAPDAITLKPGDSTTSFYSDFDPSGVEGAGEVTYAFYNVDNPTDSIHATYRYVAVDSTNSIFSTFAVQSFQVYPNPVSDALHFTAKDHGTVRFYNQQGKMVLRQNVTKGEQTIQLGILPEGLYMVRLNDSKKGISQAKVIVAR